MFLVACQPELRVLRVGTSGDYPPFSLDGEGFDVEVARILAAELGARIEWVEFRWPELADDVAASRFDVAMSGVTWRPERAVVGRMSLAVASGGPCVLGDRDPGRVAVNRGGVLERWARQRFSAAKIDAVSDNRTLPERLARGEVDAIVTDSFEVAHIRRPGFSEWCEPPRDRKVYWISPAVAGELAAPIDRFLRDHEAEIGALRGRYFEEPAPREEVDHLIDLIARRLAFMPAVAAWKQRNGRPIVDSAREQLVLARAAEQAREAGVEPAAAQRLFELLIELAVRVQERAHGEGPTMELDSELRPAILQLGDRIVASLARAVPLDPDSLGPHRFAPLDLLLERDEIDRLRESLVSMVRDDL